MGALRVGRPAGGAPPPPPQDRLGSAQGQPLLWDVPHPCPAPGSWAQQRHCPRTPAPRETVSCSEAPGITGGASHWLCRPGGCGRENWPHRTQLRGAVGRARAWGAAKPLGWSPEALADGHPGSRSAHELPADTCVIHGAVRRQRPVQGSLLCPGGRGPSRLGLLRSLGLLPGSGRLALRGSGASARAAHLAFSICKETRLLASLARPPFLLPHSARAVPGPRRAVSLPRTLCGAHSCPHTQVPVYPCHPLGLCPHTGLRTSSSPMGTGHQPPPAPVPPGAPPPLPALCPGASSVSGTLAGFSGFKNACTPLPAASVCPARRAPRSASWRTRGRWGRAERPPSRQPTPRRCQGVC